MRSASVSRIPCCKKLQVLGRALLLAPLIFAGCRKPIAEAPVPEPIPEPPAATPVPATPMPATPQPRMVEATPAPNYLAPPGVFFLLTKISVETASGITGLRPGTQVQQTGPGEYTAPDGHKLTLRPDQVTNDLRIAQHLAGADAAAQAAVRQMTAPRPAAAPVSGPATPVPGAAPTTASPSRPAAAPASSSALGAAHTRIKDGYLWQKDSQGIWVRVRPSR
jgi:hypothetical protein